jgi:hypothetical protein
MPQVLQLESRNFNNGNWKVLHPNGKHMFTCSEKKAMWYIEKGLAVFPFVVLKSPQNKSDSVLINHEKIHLRQQLELLILPFFLWYGLEFLIRLLKYIGLISLIIISYRSIVIHLENIESFGCSRF